MTKDMADALAQSQALDAAYAAANEPSLEDRVADLLAEHVQALEDEEGYGPTMCDCDFSYGNTRPCLYCRSKQTLEEVAEVREAADEQARMSRECRP